MTVVGAHDVHDSPTWNSPIIFDLFARLVRTGRFDLSGMVTDRFNWQDAPQAYQQLITRRAETMGIVLTWQ